jgi:hypothetical protein
MKFGVIDPHKRSVAVVEVKDLSEALTIAGLKLGEVDHAIVGVGLAIVVDQYSLMTPPREQTYFALAASGARRQLFGGNAVLYGFDHVGTTVNVDDKKPLHVTWISTPEAVEDAIKNGFVERPAVKLDGVTMWEWTPAPTPKAKMN